MGLPICRSAGEAMGSYPTVKDIDAQGPAFRLTCRLSNRLWMSAAEPDVAQRHCVASLIAVGRSQRQKDMRMPQSSLRGIQS